MAPLQVAHLNSRKILVIFGLAWLSTGKLTIERSVRLPAVHAEAVSNLSTQVACLSRVVKRLVCIDYEQSVGRSQQGDRLGSLVLVGVPDEGARGVHTHVRGEGIGLTVQTAGSHNVDGRRGDRERGIIPHESCVVSDLEVGGGRSGRGDHRDTSGTSSRVN